MGQCCSLPVVAADAAGPVDIRASPPALVAGSPGEHAGADPLGDLVHVLATVRTSPHQNHHQTGGSHHTHHHHHNQPSSSRLPGYGYSSNAPKQLLRATSPPPHQQQQQQQQPYGLSPRSFHQLQQLLPTVPLQQLAPEHQHPPQQSLPQQQQRQQSDVVLGKDTAALLSASNSAASGFVQARRTSLNLQEQHFTRNSSADQEHAHSSTHLQRLHNATDASSIAGSTTRGLPLVSSGSAAAAAVAAGQGHGSTNTSSRTTAADAAFSPMQVLAVCAAVVQEEPAFQVAGITPLLLASVCLIESGGCPQAKQYREHLGDTAHGLCQVLLSTAQWLATSQGFDRHGSSISIKDLEDPKACVYFAAAYLSVLSHHDSSARSEGFVIRAYHAGPKGVDTTAARSYLQKYLKAKHWLTAVAKAMAVTVAAAALAVHVQLPEAAAASADAAADAVELCGDADVKVALPAVSCAGSRNQQPSKDQGSSSSSSTAAHGGAGDAYACSSSSRQVVVWRATANLVATLSSSWDDAAVAAAAGTAAARPAATGLGAGSILAQMLPSRWGLSGSRQHSAHSGGPDVAPLTAQNALDAVTVDAASLGTAWQRMLCISSAVAAAAVDEAAAAAAMAPHPTEQDWQPNTPAVPLAAGTAGAAGSSSQDSTRRSASASSSSGRSHTGTFSSKCRTAEQHSATAAQLIARQQALQSMPCVIHIVGHGESLQGIASICRIAVSDLLAANPEITAADAVHHNDCIALPVPAVFPRLYVVQPGDTLHSIARAHDVTVGRVLAKNPELTDPSRLQPGWVVALPGLKGDSQVALPPDWLSQASLSADPSAVVVQGVPGAAYMGVQQAGRHAADDQPAATISWPADSTLPRRQRSRHQRHRLKQGVTNSTGSHLEQQQHLPPVGSGAFLFTVGDISSGNSTPGSPSCWSAGPSAGQQTGQLAAKGSRAACKGGVGASRHSEEAAHGWTVGTSASSVQ